MRVLLLSQDKKAQINTSEVPSPTGFMQFENGALTKQQLDNLLNTLPFEITFIDANDSVCFLTNQKKLSL